MSGGAPRRTGADRTVVAVGMATYRRAERLIPLVPRILDQFEQVHREFGDQHVFRLIIVDNDATGSAREAATHSGDERVSYVVEPAPGVSSARNRVLAEAHDCDLLVFIDDDETPHDRWLVNLLSAQRDFSADLVSGPVVSVFEAPLTPWVEASDDYLRLHRAGLATGDAIDRAATNNLLVDMHVVRRLGLVFDERFGFSGGEDSYFTGQLHQAGARMVWCAEARVDDIVPVDRANRSYILRRRYNMASSDVHVGLLLAPKGWPRVRFRAVKVARGTAQVAAGIFLTATGWLGRSLKRRAYGERYVARGLGTLAATLGLVAEPYKHTTG